ncbi:WRKY DNA-binding transcription factor 70-like [Rhodamnia argentea]|uniref:WRKY DNA-binding transcription factor 70-like n=1 Tax=Rhodamnia argentea TaxID=178133 RepID=A0A8B8PZY9_9MYRT|nr:WRKY DNA-binding transcription factor 70-like [Rhodamnia argentea]
MGADRPERRVMEELLLQGQSAAVQFQLLLKNPPSRDGSDRSGPSPDELLGKILRSFDEGLSVLGSCRESACAGHDRQVSPCSGESSKSKKRVDLKGRRGCHKRRKASQAWMTVSSTVEDNHAWRKYGQKVILNAKYPRSYFRCTHKHDQDCKALKQVQRMEEDPQMFHITYIGVHTCSRDNIKVPRMLITDSDTCVGESFPVKQELREEAKSDLTNDNVSSRDSFLLAGLESCHHQPNDPASVSSARMGFGDVDDSLGYELEFLRSGVSFDDEFPIEDTEFLCQ